MDFVVFRWQSFHKSIYFYITFLFSSEWIHRDFFILLISLLLLAFHCLWVFPVNADHILVLIRVCPIKLKRYTKFTIWDPLVPVLSLIGCGRGLPARPRLLAAPERFSPAPRQQGVCRLAHKNVIAPFYLVLNVIFLSLEKPAWTSEGSK